jgi:hypothetical protein
MHNLMPLLISSWDGMGKGCKISRTDKKFPELIVESFSSIHIELDADLGQLISYYFEILY